MKIFKISTSGAQKLYKRAAWHLEVAHQALQTNGAAHLEHKALFVVLDVQDALHAVDVFPPHVQNRAHPHVECLEVHRAIYRKAGTGDRVIVHRWMVHVVMAVVMRRIAAVWPAVIVMAVAVLLGMAVAMAMSMVVAVLVSMVVAVGIAVIVIVAVLVRVAVGRCGCFELCHFALHLHRTT